MTTAIDRETYPVREIDRTCDLIMRVLLPHRRSDVRHEHSRDEHPACFAGQLAPIRAFVAAGVPIEFTLPAFPCKSPNRRKVLGHLPDMGELLALRALDQLCERISQVYEPGARILVCSDGHVFGDLIHVPDQHIDAYAAALANMIEREGFRTIGTFGLADVYGSGDYDAKRAALVAQFAEPPESLRAEVRTDDATLRLYRGITRFLVEDAAGRPGSRAALQRECRVRAYDVIRRSRAWGELIARYHPHAVRLSIHPQPCRSGKFGITLLASHDVWLTPWHSVAVLRTDGRFVLMSRVHAEDVGELVHHDGRPSHYVVKYS